MSTEIIMDELEVAMEDLKIENEGLNPKREIFQILGCLMKKPDLLREKKYKIVRKDFPNMFHKSIFASIHNLVMQDAKEIDEIAIDNYLSNYEEHYEIFQQNRGMQFLQIAKDKSSLSNFDYNYNQLKKFTLLRAYQEQGMSTTEIYDPTQVGIAQQERMQAEFDRMTVDDIIKHFKTVTLGIEEEFSTNDSTSVKKAGDGAMEVKNRFKEQPLMGLGLESKMLTTLARGALKKRFMISSSDTGTGKSRLSIGELCCLCANEKWDFEKECFVDNPNRKGNAGLYIGSEMDLDEEVEPIFWAYISGVPTSKILDGDYEGNEEERVDRAIQILQESKIYLVDEPDFSIQSLERHIETHKIKYNINYVIFDYIQLTNELIAEAAAQKKGMNIREDQVLIGLSQQLKNFTAKYDIWLKTMTQVNASIDDYKNRDYQVIRGGKGMADKADIGLINMPPAPEELELIQPILKDMGGFVKKPNMIVTMYKGRGSKYPKGTKIWQHVDLGTVRTTDLFATDQYYNPIHVEKTHVKIDEDATPVDETITF